MGTMGGSAKGNNNIKGRSYAVMLLLAFGAALFGVMLLQKFRERRIFNILVKEKDRELFTLHLLLQKERDYTKELKKRTVEMKAKMYSLRSQKMQVDSRILEMQSTIASLQDEERAMKSGLEEKQNEINMLTEKDAESSKENSQVIALTEILKQKEAEIEDLKRHIEYPVKVWSVSADDPSNSSVNITENGSTTRKSNSQGTERKEESRGRSESNNGRAGKSTRVEGRSENDKNGENSERMKEGKEDSDRRGMTEDKLQKPEHSRYNGFQDGVDAAKSIDEGIRKKNEDAHNESGSRVGEERGNTNATEAADNYGKKTTIDKEDETARDRPQEKLKISQENEGQELLAISKLKMADRSRSSANSRVEGRHGYLSNAKGKRWRMIANNRRLEHNVDYVLTEAAHMRSGRFSKDKKGSERSMALTEDHSEKSNGHQNRNTDSISKDNLVQENVKLDISEKLKQGEGLRLRKHDQDDVDGREEDDGSKNRSLVNVETSKTTSNARKQKLEDGLEETMEQEKSGSGNSSDIDKVDENAVQTKVANVHEEPDELEVAANHDSNANSDDGDVIVGSGSGIEDGREESGSEVEDGREEYKEETDESEFN